MLEELGDLVLRKVEPYAFPLFFLSLLRHCSPLLLLLFLSDGHNDIFFTFDTLFGLLLLFLFFLCLLHLLHELALDLLLDTQLLELELITHQLLHLEHILSLLLLHAHVLPSLHLEGDEGASLIYQLELAICWLLPLWLRLQLKSVIVQLVKLVTILFANQA